MALLLHAILSPCMETLTGIIETTSSINLEEPPSTHCVQVGGYDCNSGGGGGGLVPSAVKVYLAIFRHCRSLQLGKGDGPSQPGRLWQLWSHETLDRLWEGPDSSLRKQWGLRQSGDQRKNGEACGPSVS